MCVHCSKIQIQIANLIYNLLILLLQLTTNVCMTIFKIYNASRVYHPIQSGSMKAHAIKKKFRKTNSFKSVNIQKTIFLLCHKYYDSSTQELKFTKYIGAKHHLHCVTNKVFYSLIGKNYHCDAMFNVGGNTKFKKSRMKCQ